MKKSFILIITLVITCSSAMAVYIDTPNNVALLHCDIAVTNWWGAPNTNSYWLTTPDDNSSGRPACEPILNKTNVGEFAMDSATTPTFVPGSPYGGDYLSFNGSNSSIYVNNGWLGDTSISLDFSFRWLDLPDVSDNYAGVLGCVPWRCYFKNAGDGQHGFLQFLMQPGNVFFPNAAPIYLASNVWYDVHFTWFEQEMTLIVGNPTDGYATNFATTTEDLAGDATQLTIGYGLWVPSRLFHGDLDEIRYGYVIPEPTLFWILSFGFLMCRFVRR